MKRADRTGRTLKFLCINDADTREVRDMGFTKDGTKTGQRQAVERMRDKVARIGGRDVAVFALAEAPTEDFSDRDPLDRSFKTNTGEWMLPSKEWLALRAERVQLSKAKTDEQEERTRNLATSKLADQLGNLMNMANSQVKP